MGAGAVVDVNKPVENPELVAAIEALQAEFSPERKQVFFERLREAHLLLLLAEPLEGERGEDGSLTLTAGANISIPMLSDGEGRPFHFGFTDWAALRAFRDEENQQTLIARFDDWMFMALGEKDGRSTSLGMMLNPRRHELFLPRDLLVQLKAPPQTGSYTVPGDTKVMLGEPREYPQALVNAVTAAIRPLRQVKRAWLQLMVKEGEQSFLIVVDFAGDRETVSRTVGEAAGPHLPPGMFVDVMAYGPGFGENAVKGKKPFFKRGLLGR